MADDKAKLQQQADQDAVQARKAVEALKRIDTPVALEESEVEVGGVKKKVFTTTAYADQKAAEDALKALTEKVGGRDGLNAGGEQILFAKGTRLQAAWAETAKAVKVDDKWVIQFQAEGLAAVGNRVDPDGFKIDLSTSYEAYKKYTFEADRERAATTETEAKDYAGAPLKRYVDSNPIPKLTAAELLALKPEDRAKLTPAGVKYEKAKAESDFLLTRVQNAAFALGAQEGIPGKERLPTYVVTVGRDESGKLAKAGELKTPVAIVLGEFDDIDFTRALIPGIKDRLAKAVGGELTGYGNVRVVGADGSKHYVDVITEEFKDKEGKTKFRLRLTATEEYLDKVGMSKFRPSLDGLGALGDHVDPAKKTFGVATKPLMDEKEVAAEAFGRVTGLSLTKMSNPGAPLIFAVRDTTRGSGGYTKEIPLDDDSTNALRLKSFSDSKTEVTAEEARNKVFADLKAFSKEMGLPAPTDDDVKLVTAKKLKSGGTAQKSAEFTDETVGTFGSPLKHIQISDEYIARVNAEVARDPEKFKDAAAKFYAAQLAAAKAAEIAAKQKIEDDRKAAEAAQKKEKSESLKALNEKRLTAREVDKALPDLTAGPGGTGPGLATVNRADTTKATLTSKDVAAESYVINLINPQLGKDGLAYLENMRTVFLTSVHEKLTKGTPAQQAQAAKFLITPEDIIIYTYKDEKGVEHQGLKLSEKYLEEVQKGTAGSELRREALQTFIKTKEAEKAVPPAPSVMSPEEFSKLLGVKVRHELVTLPDGKKQDSYVIDYLPDDAARKNFLIALEQKTNGPVQGVYSEPGKTQIRFDTTQLHHVVKAIDTRNNPLNYGKGTFVAPPALAPLVDEKYRVGGSAAPTTPVVLPAAAPTVPVIPAEPVILAPIVVPNLPVVAPVARPTPAPTPVKEKTATDKVSQQDLQAFEKRLGLKLVPNEDGTKFVATVRKKTDAEMRETYSQLGQMVGITSISWEKGAKEETYTITFDAAQFEQMKANLNKVPVVAIPKASDFDIKVLKAQLDSGKDSEANDAAYTLMLHVADKGNLNAEKTQDVLKQLDSNQLKALNEALNQSLEPNTNRPADRLLRDAVSVELDRRTAPKTAAVTPVPLTVPPVPVPPPPAPAPGKYAETLADVLKANGTKPTTPVKATALSNSGLGAVDLAGASNIRPGDAVLITNMNNALNSFDIRTGTRKDDGQVNLTNVLRPNTEREVNVNGGKAGKLVVRVTEEELKALELKVTKDADGRTHITSKSGALVSSNTVDIALVDKDGNILQQMGAVEAAKKLEEARQAKLAEVSKENLAKLEKEKGILSGAGTRFIVTGASTAVVVPLSGSTPGAVPTR